MTMKKKSRLHADDSRPPPEAAGTPVIWFGAGRPTDETDSQVARLSALAVQVFGSRDKADRWLRRPRREFGDLCPLEMMETPAGARQVELLLAQRAPSGA